MMVDLPGTTPEGWRATLEEAHSLDPPHVSSSVNGARFSRPRSGRGGHGVREWYSDGGSNGRPPLPQDEASADAYRTASSFWRSRGYLHSEVSSYARSADDISRHNSAYWQASPMLASVTCR